jgi:hypothetical protein
MRTMEHLMNDNRAEWLNNARGWQASQESAFRRMQRAQMRNDVEAFHDAAYDHADCHERVLLCMEFAAKAAPLRGTLDDQMVRETGAGW